MADNKVVYTLSLQDLFTNKLKEAEGATNRFEGKVNGVTSAIKGLGIAAATTFGAYFGVEFLSGSIEMYDEAAKSTGRTVGVDEIKAEDWAVVAVFAGHLQDLFIP